MSKTQLSQSEQHEFFKTLHNEIGSRVWALTGVSGYKELERRVEHIDPTTAVCVGYASIQCQRLIANMYYYGHSVKIEMQTTQDGGKRINKTRYEIPYSDPAFVDKVVNTIIVCAGVKKPKSWLRAVNSINKIFREFGGNRTS